MNPFDLIKNFQALQGQMTEMQDRLKNVTVTGASGGDMVKILMNGQMEVLDVIIAPEIVNPGEVGMLEDLVLSALSDAHNKIKEKIQSEMGDSLGGMGLNLPGLG